MTALAQWIEHLDDEWIFGLTAWWAEQDEEADYEWLMICEVRRGAFERLSAMLTEDEATEIVAEAGDDLDYLSDRVSEISWDYWQGAIKVNGRWISAYPELARRQTRLEAFMERNGIANKDQAIDALLDAVEPQTARRLEIVAA